MTTGITRFIFNVIVRQMLRCLFQRVFLKETLVLICWQVFVFGTFVRWKILLDIAKLIIRKKKLNYNVIGSLHSCRKVKYVWSSHLPEVISAKLLIGNDLFVCKYQLSVNKKFPNSHYFYWNLANRLTFICTAPYDKYNLSYSKS